MMRFLLSGSVLIFITGCASLSPQLGYESVRDTVSHRTGTTIAWARDSEEAAALQAEVNALLEAPLAPTDAVRVAILNNRHLQATYEELGIAQAEVVEAGRMKNPVFEAVLKFPEGGGGTHVEMSVVASFLDLLYIPMREALAESEYRSAQTRVTAAVLDTAASAQRAYYELQSARQLLDMRQTVLASAQASAELAHRIREAGNSTALDLANAQAFAESARIDFMEAESNAAQARQKLGMILGLPADREFAIADRMADLPVNEFALSEIEPLAIGQNLELEALRLEIERESRRLKIAEPMAWLGDAEIGAQAEWEGGEDKAFGPVFAIPIPIFNQGQPAVATSKARLRQARQTYLAREIEITRMTRAAHQRVLATRGRAEHIRNVLLPLRQTILDETQKHYNAMQIGAFELLAARESQVESAAEYVDALKDYWLANVELNQIVAGLTSAFEQE